MVDVTKKFLPVIKRQGNGKPEGEMDALLLGTTKELVASTPSQRNYKGILIALLVICAVCGLIVLAIQLLRPPDDGPRVKGRKVTLADISAKRFLRAPFNGSWISSTEIMFRDPLGGVSIFSAETLTATPLVTNTTFRQLNARRYAVSADQKFILLIHDVSPLWEHSFLAKYDVYDIANQFKESLTPEPARNPKEVDLQFAEWGPRGSQIVLVYKNDIYYKEDSNSNATVRITNTGKEGIIFNGIPDWLYEVMILKSSKALWISPDGNSMVYATFNDSDVGEVSYSMYGDSAPYPKLKRWRYPKAGTTNPEVTLWAVKLNDDFHSTQIKSPEGIHSRDDYISNVQWIRNDTISVIWTNRVQNTAIYTICSSNTWNCEVIYTLRPPSIAWIDFPQPPIFSSDLTKCVLRIPWLDGDAGYFHHVIWMDFKSGKEIPLTHGPFEVTQISAWDQTNQFVYFIGVPKGKPGERHLYRSKERASNSTIIVPPTCLTCTNSVATLDLDPFDYTLSLNVSRRPSSSNTDPPKDPNKPACLFSQVHFSPGNDFYVRECLGPGVPTATLHQAPSGRLLFVLNPNVAFKREVGNLGLPQVKTFRVELSRGYGAPVRLFLPPGFRENEEFKFPLLLHIAGAPGSQLVSEKWRLSWASYLTSQKNFIVAEIDGRGSGFQGDKLRQTVYQNLGVQEVIDQLEVVRYLKEKISFIDEKNIGVWGKGYGGFLTLLTLAQDTNNLFRCGIAVAPITKWDFYDTVQSERYLGLPNMTENFEGYEKGDVVRVAKKLKNKKLLLIHGTGDENVHYQHTMHLTKTLVREGLSFTEQIYPDEGHAFSGVTEHFYKSMETFLDQNFDKPDWEDWEKANFLGISV